jgi:hypothetical protein
MHMPNRTAKFVSAVFASLVAGAPLATISHGATPAADDCLAGPKEQTPQGGHWYYRIEHPSNRHCWYLRDENDKLSQVAVPNASAPVKPVAPNTATTMQPSIANAHAELPVQAPVGQDTDSGQPLNVADPNLPRSVVASRWLDPSSVSSSAAAGPTPVNPVAAKPSNSAAPPPVVAAVPLAAADALPENAETPSGSIRMVLLAIIGALSLAGILGSAIFRFGGGRVRIARHDIRVDRRAIWDSAGTDARSPPRAADDPNRRLAEMLARLSRSSTA